MSTNKLSDPWTGYLWGNTTWRYQSHGALAQMFSMQAHILTLLEPEISFSLMREITVGIKGRLSECHHTCWKVRSQRGGCLLLVTKKKKITIIPGRALFDRQRQGGDDRNRKAVCCAGFFLFPLIKGWCGWSHPRPTTSSSSITVLPSYSITSSLSLQSSRNTTSASHTPTGSRIATAPATHYLFSPFCPHESERAKERKK